MKKVLILALSTILSGCSLWNDFSWDSLNPWSGDEEETAVVQSQTEKQLPENVNKYLWQASLDKLAVLGIETENSEEGRIITAWKTPTGVSSERFKIVAEINSGELRADALDVKSYKEVRRGNGWVKIAPSQGFENSIAQAIIKQAKVLYINDKD